MHHILSTYFNPTLTLLKARLQPYFKHILKLYPRNHPLNKENIRLHSLPNPQVLKPILPPTQPTPTQTNPSTNQPQQKSEGSTPRSIKYL